MTVPVREKYQMQHSCCANSGTLILIVLSEGYCLQFYLCYTIPEAQKLEKQRRHNQDLLNQVATRICIN